MLDRICDEEMYCSDWEEAFKYAREPTKAADSDTVDVGPFSRKDLGLSLEGDFVWQEEDASMSRPAPGPRT